MASRYRKEPTPPRPPNPAYRTIPRSPVNAPLRIRQPKGLPQKAVGQRRRAPLHPVSPHRDPESPGPGAPEPPATAPHLPALAPSRDSFRRHGDVFVAVDKVTPRKVGAA